MLSAICRICFAECVRAFFAQGVRSPMARCSMARSAMCSGLSHVRAGTERGRTDCTRSGRRETGTSIGAALGPPSSHRSRRPASPLPGATRSIADGASQGRSRRQATSSSVRGAPRPLIPQPGPCLERGKARGGGQRSEDAGHIVSEIARESPQGAPLRPTQDASSGGRGTIQAPRAGGRHYMWYRRHRTSGCTGHVPLERHPITLLARRSATLGRLL